MGKLAALLRVLRAGEELRHVETWKRRQNAISALVALLGGVLLLLPVFGLRLEVAEDDLVAIAGGIAAVVGVLNAYLTTATTRRIGLPPVGGADPGDGPSDPPPPDILRGAD